MSDTDEALLLADFGQRLRAARLARGLNLHQLARLTGISAPALSLIETGKRDPRLTTLHKLSAALRLSPGDLLGAPSHLPAQAKGDGYDLEDYR
jgi:HTH-type transcriptional regulator, competence development regulator